MFAARCRHSGGRRYRNLANCIAIKLVKTPLSLFGSTETAMKHILSPLTFSAAFLFCAVGLFAQGTLTPAGAPVASMKTLDQIEPRTPVDATHTPGDGGALYIISQPGSYYLTGNLNVVAATAGIRITSDNVVLDLGGFGLNGNSIGSYGVLMVGSRQNITVRNGTSHHWTQTGVDLSGASNASAENLMVSSNAVVGIAVGENSLVKNCRAYRNCFPGGVSSAGILTGAGATVIDCQAQGNNGTNIAAINVGTASSVINCTVNQNNGNNSAGIRTGSSCNVLNCSVGSNTGNNGTGIDLGSDSSAVNCNASGNSGTSSVGIFASGGRSTVSACRANFNGGDGIKAVDSSSILSNSCASNTGAGIHTTAQGNRVDGNHVNNNSNSGIKCDSSNSFIVRNTARNNSLGNYSITSGNADAQVITGSSAFTTTNAWANLSL